VQSSKHMRLKAFGSLLMRVWSLRPTSRSCNRSFTVSTSSSRKLEAFEEPWWRSIRRSHTSSSSGSVSWSVVR